MAGNAWLNSFLNIYPELTIRQAEGLSVARGQELNRDETSDESGFPLINEPGKVLTSKGSRSTHKERGENITSIGCFNAEGRYITPVLIMKGVNIKQGFCDGLLAGSDKFFSCKCPRFFGICWEGRCYSLLTQLYNSSTSTIGSLGFFFFWPSKASYNK
ncbi:hypothetical protein PR048_013034 [Dryococelus australis]|uniref:Uncharacterized protein n=1 Tax=Dryococelus australis TaxID=614101 RepID=A0ABQ9HRH0_9NEOP|nr:hypothetical protein PR048_013034 [Dryococelus australis]